MLSDSDKFVIKMNDCGMVGASILPGDNLTVKRQRDAAVGEIVVAIYDGQPLIRWLGLKNNALHLIPDNDSYIPVRGRDVTIIGKVVSMQRDLETK